MYAEVIIEYPVKSLDKSFTYLVKEDDQKIIKVGMKVVVPFGKSVVNGIVIKITSAKPDYETKEICYIDNPDVYLNAEQMDLGKYLKDETLCTLITAYQTMLPSALKIKNQKHSYDLYDTFISLNTDLDSIEKYIVNHERSHKQIEILDLLKTQDVLKKDIAGAPLNTLIKNRLVKEVKVKKARINAQSKVEVLPVLNEEQQKAYEIVNNNINHYQTYLLQGVTGSGKTEVYMRLIKDVLDLGKTAIVLVPEICLTTQTVKRFYNRFGSDVAIFHSGLSNGEKYDEYLKIYHNEVKIVVGTRSSIFVPLQSLGIIIIDEEHSETYKQDSNPRYNAIDMAIYRAKKNNIPLILASATPSLESRARADKGVYSLITLNKRANNMELPTTTVVDMTLELKKRNFIFSDILKEKINERLEKKEQIILLLNRRGFSTFINCTMCGYTYKCPNCDITLTYHKTINNLRCHYCGYVIKKDDVCPKCHEAALNYLGLGTEKLEEELSKIYPNAKLVRMDQDTTSTKGSYQRIIDDFADGKYDILLGTQMISKGLDFKNVTLVGVINADTSLNLPDFRANEKTFALLYQTSGRAGRDKKAGEVIIQTFNPDNEVLKYVKENDYNKFYLYEMHIRHQLKYPPYTYICILSIKSKEYDLASVKATEIKKILSRKLDKKSIVFGPTPAAVFKVNNVYNFQITIKYTFDEYLKNTLKEIDEMCASDKKVNIEITFNPSRF
ncbi:MAG: primosomal protein N' [Firmicutes bacterium]|nr:primosomal protein N' [Bacillota bacterium]